MKKNNHHQHRRIIVLVMIMIVVVVIVKNTFAIIISRRCFVTISNGYPIKTLLSSSNWENSNNKEGSNRRSGRSGRRNNHKSRYIQSKRLAVQTICLSSSPGRSAGHHYSYCHYHWCDDGIGDCRRWRCGNISTMTRKQKHLR